MRHALIPADNSAHKGKTKEGHLRMETMYDTRK